MDNKELKLIIKNHRHWLDEDADNWRAMRADLRDADLRDADLKSVNLKEANLWSANLRNANLSYADLRDANLRYANLRYADLKEADLRDADLRDADLRYADLRFANLWSTNLSGANLEDADLRYANLMGANLRNANLYGTDLWSTNLCDADLRGANLRGANLRYADLKGADLRGAKNVPYIPMVCPEEGDFIGYKKAHDKIVKLLIPKDAKRSSATTRKCRCNKAKVLGIYELDGSVSNVTEVSSSRDSNFIYRINKEVVVEDFDEDRWHECSTGIHFFMQKQEAIDYQS